MSRTAAARVREITPVTPQARAQSQAQAERRAKLLEFFKDPPADVLAAADAVGRARERYGDATGLERADIEAGRRSSQRTSQKTKSTHR